MANIWKKGPLSVNPYHENAFQVLGLTRDVTSRADIDQRVGERREAVRNMPGHHRLGGRDLTLADVTRARRTLLDPTSRILEGLLEHRPEVPEVEEIERIEKRSPAPEVPAASSPHNLRFLLLGRRELAFELLENLAPVEVPAFPVDLTPIPPFGIIEEDGDD